jgi:hypothetical protein
MRRTLIATALCSALLALLARPVAADCSGPYIVVDERKVDAGADLLLTGVAWGDNCYDTGPPPPGEGTLGVPVSEIDIVIQQGGERWLVATGSADADYGFTVTVELPAQLQPGRAEIRAEWDGRTAWTQDAFVIVVDGPSNGTGDVSVASFGPSPSSTPPPSETVPTTAAPLGSVATTSTDPGRSEQGADSDDVLLIAVIAAAVVAGVLIARRVSLAQRQPPKDSSR